MEDYELKRAVDKLSATINDIVMEHLRFKENATKSTLKKEILVALAGDFGYQLLAKTT